MLTSTAKGVVTLYDTTTNVYYSGWFLACCITKIYERQLD